MSTIHIPYRPPGYLERQGYVKPLWQVKLRRSDTKQDYFPDDEAYNLPAVKAKLESDKYSVSTIDHITLELTRTDELVDFLGGLADPKRLSIKISVYLIFRKRQKQLVWFGQLQNLPEGTDAYPSDKLRLTFTSPPGAWEDGDTVKDPDTETWFKNKHVYDVLLPKFIKKGRAQAGSGTYRLEEPFVRSDDYFWSGSELPRKKLAVPSAKYDDTYQVKSLCWDSTRKLLYMGVWSSHSPKNPWLISYNPATRHWAKVCRFQYVGPHDWRELPITGWEVLHLEYDATADKVWYVCQTTEINLKKPRAHYKCYGSINPATPPKTVNLVGANLFTLHNKGVVVRSKPVSFDNYGPVHTNEEGATHYYAYAVTESIGWGTPRGEKEHGVLTLAGRLQTKAQGYIYAGVTWIRVNPNLSIKDGISYNVEIWDQDNSRRENAGYVTGVKRSFGFYEIGLTQPTQYYYSKNHDVFVYLTDPAFHPEDNTFVGKPQNVKVLFHFADGLKSPDAETVYVEGREGCQGRDQFFWPRNLGEIDETSELYIDRVGYSSFIEFRDMEMYDSTAAKDNNPRIEYYSSGPVAPFEVQLEGYRPAFLLADGFSVRSTLQRYGAYGPVSQPGKCRLVKDGVTCRVSDGRKLETYGDIFLWKDGSTVWAAWNDHGWCGHTRQYFSQCKIGRWDPAKNMFRKVFVDRLNSQQGRRWWNDPECYITSFARYAGKCYGGRRYYEPNWVPTNLRIFWVAPPQGAEKNPTGYDGSLVAIALVTGDRTDIFEAGTLLRLGPAFNKSRGKIYYVSEVETGSRKIKSDGEFLTSAWREITNTPTGDFRGQITWLHLLSIDADGVRQSGYKEHAKYELGDKFISFMRGRKERHQIWRL